MNFVRGIESDTEKKNGDRHNDVSQMEIEDVTSKLIRDEALRTWNLGKRLGVLSNEANKFMVEKVAESEGRGHSIGVYKL